MHTTLVYGLLNPAYLFGGERGGVGSGQLSVAELNGEISDVLVADGAGVPFNSIGKVGASVPGPADADADADADACRAALASGGMSAAAPLPRWKFFSPQRLSDSELGAALLCRAEHVVRHAWDAPGAYPVSRPLPPATQGDRGFVLDETESWLTKEHGAVLHPSAIEASTSAMEVMAVAGTNAARLVIEHIKDALEVEAKDASSFDEHARETTNVKERSSVNFFHQMVE